ncbi:MAG: XRE family transcriptional regulator [Prevotella sp.]|jgi:repressor LexA
MEKAVNQRIRQIIEKGNLSVNAFAKKIGVPQRTLANMLSRGTEPSAKTINAVIATFPNLNKDWLLTGTGPMIITEDTPVDENGKPVETRPRLPMTVVAGGLIGFADSAMLSDCEQVPIIRAFPDYDCTMIVQGNSMEPKFEGGDEIAMRKVHDFIEWGKAHVLDTRDGAVLKRLYDAGDSFRCVSFNPEYPDFEVSKADVGAVYKIVGLIRR